MKPFLTKAWDTITLRRRPTVTRYPSDINLDVTCLNSHAEHREHSREHHNSDSSSGGWCVYCNTSSLEDIDTDDDNVVYCKNNVMLKVPNRRSKLLSSGSPGNFMDMKRNSSPPDQPIPMRNLPPSASSNTLHGSSYHDDNTLLIPGYFHISTRGSNFGQVLILNWRSNASMTGTSTRPSPPRMGLGLSLGGATGGGASSHRNDKNSVSIDLSQVESIKIFYQDEEGGVSGEVVICTRDRNFKMFAFKNGGLNELIKKFCQWKYFNHQHSPHAKQYLFNVFQPRLSLAELHPEEGLVNGMLTEELWRQLKDPSGKIVDKKFVLQTVFFRGLHSSLRSEVWPYLLGLLDYDKDNTHNAQKRTQITETYCQLDLKREQLPNSRIPPLQLQQIRNDINRTDRIHPFYKDDDSINLKRLQNILLNYLFVYRPDISYCQGMTDLLSPLLYSLDDEAQAFYCFSVIIEKTAFFKPAKDRVSLRRQLTLLSTLVELLLPWFYTYLTETEDGLTFVFAHRWLLVYMKREFKLEDAITIWESCWTNYSTNFFIFFVCIAVMAMYGQRAIDQEMTLNELTVHFSALSNSMPVDIVLSQARGYLYRFMQCKEVPCCLRSVMSDDYWDLPQSPRLSCDGHDKCGCGSSYR